MKAAGNSCEQELLGLVMEMFSELPFRIHVRIYFYGWIAQHLTNSAASSAVGMISVRNFQLGCNSHTCLWQIPIFRVCRLLARSSKRSSVYDATQPLTLAVTKQDLGDFCKTSVKGKAIEFSSNVFFSLQHIMARNAQAPPQHLGATSQADPITACSSRGGQLVRHSLGHKCVW